MFRNIYLSGRKNRFEEWHLWAFFLLVFILGTILFYPKIYSSIDEHSYIKNALLLREGKIAIEDPTTACRGGAYVDGLGYVAPQFIGTSLFLIPFTLFNNLTIIMAFGIVFGLINFFIFAKILKKIGVHYRYSFLLLLYPAMVWITRTVYAETILLTFALLGLYFYLSDKKKDWVIAGIMFGIGVLIRPDSIFICGAFAIASLFKREKKYLYLAIGIIPFVLVYFAINSLIYGGALSSGYGGILNIISHRTINLANFITLVGVFLLCYPAMLSSFLITKKFPLKWEYAFLLLYFIYLTTYTYVDGFDFNPIVLFTGRLRYFIPFIGLMMVPYAYMIEQTFKNKAIYYIAILGLLLLSLVAMSVHAKFLNERAEVLNQINSTIPDNALVIGSSDDCMYFLQGITGNKRYLNVDLGADLANNPKNLKIEEFLNDNTYVMQLLYSNRGGESDRQKIIDAERKKMSDFLIQNKDSLWMEKTFTSPHWLQIYKRESKICRERT